MSLLFHCPSELNEAIEFLRNSSSDITFFLKDLLSVFEP